MSIAGKAPVTHTGLLFPDELPEYKCHLLEDVPPELRACIDEENPVVRQRHLARPRHPPAADQAGVGNKQRGARNARVVWLPPESP